MTINEICPELFFRIILGCEIICPSFFWGCLDILLFVDYEGGKTMPKKNGEEAEVKNFEVEQMFPGHPKHKRHAFSFTVGGNEFKGHFNEGEITWMNPHPKQMYSEEKVDEIENKIHGILSQQGISNQLQDIEMTQAFQDRLHERRQVILKVMG